MVTTRFALFFCLLMGILSLAWGYYDGGTQQPLRWLLGLGVVWAFALIRRWSWFSAFGLFVLLGFSAAGLWFGLAPGWMIAGALFALLVWDLTDFERRLRLASEDDDANGLARVHLTRLSLVALIGFALASIAMIVRVQFPFEWAALMALVAALGLSQLIGWMRRGQR
ncbi:MAG: hypothetical protein AB1564_05525 [Chloroflexota bacterium]